MAQSLPNTSRSQRKHKVYDPLAPSWWSATLQTALSGTLVSLKTHTKTITCAMCWHCLRVSGSASRGTAVIIWCGVPGAKLYAKQRESSECCECWGHMGSLPWLMATDVFTPFILLPPSPFLFIPLIIIIIVILHPFLLFLLLLLHFCSGWCVGKSCWGASVLFVGACPRCLYILRKSTCSV